MTFETEFPNTLSNDYINRGMIHSLQIALKDLAHNVMVNSKQIELIRKKLAAIEPMAYESNCEDEGGDLW